MVITDCLIQYSSLDISRSAAVRYRIARKDIWGAQTAVGYSGYIHSVLRFFNLSAIPSANL